MDLKPHLPTLGLMLYVEHDKALKDLENIA